MSRVWRLAGLPVLAVVLVVGVVLTQLAAGGGTYEPLHPADPCAARSATSLATGIDALSERLVLLGVNNAACTLGVSREALTLQLAEQTDPTDAQVDALRAGLHTAVQQMKADNSLPATSSLVDEALDQTDLNGFLKSAIRALPDSLVNSALPLDDVLDRTIDGLDLRSVLANLDDGSGLDQQVNAAITQAVKDALVDRVRGIL